MYDNPTTSVRRRYVLKHVWVCQPYITENKILMLLYIYTGCNRRNGPDFGRVFLMLNYTEKPPKLNGLGDNGQ
jgi:hypothetical protein